MSGFVPELEQEVLGAILMGGNPHIVPGALRPESFVEPLHQEIFANIEKAYENYSTANLSVVLSMTDTSRREAIEKALGIPLSEYLARLASDAPVRGLGGIRKSIEAMNLQAARLQIGAEASRIAAAADDPATNPQDLIRTFNATADSVTAGIRANRKTKTQFSFDEASNAALEAAQAARNSGAGLVGISTGLADLDRATGGFRPSELTILGGRPAMGKSAVGLGFALRAALADEDALYISLEMAAPSLAMRALTDLAYDEGHRIAYSDILNNRTTDRDFETVWDVKTRHSKLPLYIEDAAGLTLGDIRRKLENVNDRIGREGRSVKILLVDYLQLIAATGRYAGNRTLEISEISAGLRGISREFGIPVVALSQLSRQVESREDKRPLLSDLRESGSIEQDADVVLFAYREEYYAGRTEAKNPDDEIKRQEKLDACRNKLELNIAKQRNGATRTVHLFVDIACSAIRNAARS
ncbi:DNA helicase [Metarhizobium album]|uniref:DNA 5'-3' helicase n=1 Tax=Metarhizobium album TaxID=2182425 RepID=A0A2U2DHI9_9HYPH|nr:DnaB-like helicase C-terminal domain-containing protein [Rhizobium album]PWE52769.1 DNA helicase [Rhizobium album]